MVRTPRGIGTLPAQCKAELLDAQADASTRRCARIAGMVDQAQQRGVAVLMIESSLLIRFVKTRPLFQQFMSRCVTRHTHCRSLAPEILRSAGLHRRTTRLARSNTPPHTTGACCAALSARPHALAARPGGGISAIAPLYSSSHSRHAVDCLLGLGSSAGAERRLAPDRAAAAREAATGCVARLSCPPGSAQHGTLHPIA